MAIDEEETYKRFGYHSYDLSPKSSEKIVVRCDDCGKARIIQKRGYRSLCTSCVQKGEHVSRIERTRLICGTTFRVTAAKLKQSRCNYCSKACEAISKRKRVTLKCGFCGKEISVKPSEIAKHSNFCSRECKCKWQSGKLTKKEGHSEGPKGEKHPLYERIKTECSYCGKELSLQECQLKSSERHFCSKECYSKWQSENLRGENSPKYNRIRTKCAYCGKELLLIPARIAKTANFCSKECRSKWHSENLNGENAPAWQGGLSYEPYCEKFNEAFRERIRDKFDRKCFICGKQEEENGQKLSVHHVNYSKDCLCSDDQKCQFVPLCDSCHGKTNFNRECWEEYLMSKLRSRLDGYYI